MSDPNVFEPAWEAGTPPGLRGARVGAAAGATELGATVYELAPGAAISPYHLHHGNEELLVVLSGRPLLRTPDGTRRLEPGAVVAFPRGPDGAHRVANPGDEPARVLLVSTMNLPEIAVHVTTGTVLTMTALGQGHAWPADGDEPFVELYGKAMELDAAEDGRSTS
jgi:uncharacterized cupin superfamily protein